MAPHKLSPISLNPFAALKAAVAKVPQLKYALAVMGIAAVVAIVLTWISDPRIAIFGIVITIALMYILAIFAQSITQVAGRRWLAAFLAWSVAVLFVAVLVLLTMSYAFGVPKTLSERLFPALKVAVLQNGGSEKPTATLSGTVLDQNNEGLQGASVTLDDFPRMKAVETSSDGVFTINQIPKKYGEGVRLRVVLKGYEPNPYTEDLVLGGTPPRVKLTKIK